MSVTVRAAAEADMAAIQAIYAPHVLRGFATFEEVPPDVAEMTAAGVKAAPLNSRHSERKLVDWRWMEADPSALRKSVRVWRR